MAVVGWGAMDEDLLRDAPSWTPNPVELADLELLLSGAYAPLIGFLGPSDLDSLATTGRLADGTDWPVPVTLAMPEKLTDRGAVILTDPEGAPVAALRVTEVGPPRPDGTVIVGGPVTVHGDGHHGVFPRLRRTPAQVRAALTAERVLGVIADRPLHRPQLAQIAHAARTIGGQVLVLVPVAESGPDGLPAESLVRSVFAAADRMPPAEIVAVPLVRQTDEVRAALLRGRIAANYGATHLLSTSDMMISGGGLRIVVPRDLAYDTRDGQWRASDDIPPRFQRAAMTPDEIDELLDEGSSLPEWHTPPSVNRELTRSRPPRRTRGVVVFFTGLSGSGKSTVARGVADALRESGERTVTLLDGDVVRRELSAGLTFSKADRDINIRRIGWVAAEVARHGGMAICCPIAPYEAARAAARAQAQSAGGGFVLVHVATPLEVCELRDRKGLYARARAGQITGMTGIDDPYETPVDAEITLDTSTMTIDDAIAYVLTELSQEGWIDPRL
ncbi:MAG TPA: adenylyl-sulfate kinase [Micromonosporaceae bacterium]